jgi:hypothetical protein
LNTSSTNLAPHEKVAADFASALIAGRFDTAHQMLSSAAKREWPAALLEETYSEMVEYFESPPEMVQVVQSMSEGPAIEPGDIGWAYAAIIGDEESEAVSVVVFAEDGRNVIRSIEWGRP